MYDAVHLFAKALHDLDTSQQIDIHPLSCDGQVRTKGGLERPPFLFENGIEAWVNIFEFLDNIITNGYTSIIEKNDKTINEKSMAASLLPLLLKTYA